ncbi:MAG: hypothetical protein H0W87_05005 [Actinobacteria bacterium]|nr:hypothetical protein [Actinomycetota bacterium]
MRFFTVLGVILVCALSSVATASGSTLFARDATNVKLAVSADGQKALITYKVNGVTKRVLASGAVNALQPSESVPQVQFNVAYLTTGLKDKQIWQNFKNKCKSYDGPTLAFVVTACKAPDGSYWAVQSWKYWLPYFGYLPWLPYQDDTAFHVSHWTGPLAELEAWASWIDVGHGATSPHDLIARLTYGGMPVFGYKVGNGGQPQDGYGRVVYIETLDSLLGAGWLRLTGILTRNPSGMLCHSMVPQMAYSSYPSPHIVDAGNGKNYRLYVEGPGVTPLVTTEVADPGDFNVSDPAKVQRQATGKSLLQQWQAPAACTKGH